jgi:hypothetical protein
MGHELTVPEEKEMTSRSKLSDLINKVRKNDENSKVMKREDFQE